MFKLAAIIGGVLVMAGAALAGTLTSLGSTNSPTIGQTPLVSTTTPIDETTTGIEDRSRENEVRGRANEAGEDLRGPCDEAEHANDPRCTGAAVASPRADDDIADDRVDDNFADDRGGDNSGPSSNSGPSEGSGHGSSGHGGGDDGDHSGHGGHGRDD